MKKPMHSTHSSGKVPKEPKKKSDCLRQAWYPNLLCGRTGHTANTAEANGRELTEEERAEWKKVQKGPGHLRVLGSITRWLMEVCSTHKGSAEFAVALYIVIMRMGWDPKKDGFLQANIRRTEIAEGLGISERTVSRCLARLGEKKIIKVDYRMNKTKRTDGGRNGLTVTVLYGGSFIYKKFSHAEQKRLCDTLPRVARGGYVTDYRGLARGLCDTLPLKSGGILDITLLGISDIGEKNQTNTKRGGLRVQLPERHERTLEDQRMLHDITEWTRRVEHGGTGTIGTYPFKQFAWVRPVIILQTYEAWRALNAIERDIGAGKVFYSEAITKALHEAGLSDWLRGFQQLSRERQQQYVDGLKVPDRDTWLKQKQEQQQAGNTGSKTGTRSLSSLVDSAMAGLNIQTN